MERSKLESWLDWNARGRALSFILAATSIWCLLAEMYGLCSMRLFAVWVLLPATLLLAAMAAFDAIGGPGRLCRALAIGCLAGLLAAAAYDVFRLPFVFAKPWGVDRWIPAMPLFKVFPRFGALLLGQPLEQDSYGASAQALGWLYHFQNGATLGVMYVALIGDPGRRSWLWGIATAVAIEGCLLLSPYASFFGIQLTARFVIVTLTTHVVFGANIGLWAKWHAGEWTPRAAVA
jgi:hypothetical protein